MRLRPVPEDPEQSDSRRLARRLRLARLALAWERLWPALVPLLSLAAGFAALALLDVLPRLPGWLHGLVLSAFAGGLGYLGWRGFGHWRWPGEDEAARRLERDSGLAHRPLSALGDRMAAGGDDPVAQALWRLHRRRMAEQAHRLRVDWPAPGVPARDPHAIRFAALLALVIALVGGWGDAGRRLSRALVPAIGTPGLPSSLEVWITPPAYTGVAPILLRPGQAQDAPTVVPAGSTVLAVLAGGWGGADLDIDGGETPFRRLDDGSQRVEIQVDAGSRLAVEQGWRTVASWPIGVARDALPSIAFAQPPEGGERGRLKVAVEASDDYGLAKAWVAIRRLGAAEDEEPLVLELPLPGGRPKAASFASWHDLTAHPWSGLPVTMTPAAQDFPGQVGTGEPVTVTLPERQFNNPVARAVVEKRRLLSEDRGQWHGVGRWLEHLTTDPGLIGGDELAFLALKVAAKDLAGPDFDLAEVQDLMWNAALRIEEGDLAGAEKELEEARRALDQALAGDASPDEVQRLLDQFEQALARYMEAMAERMAAEDGGEGQQQGQDRVVTDEDLQQMMDGMRGLAETGNREALRQMLNDLSQMLAGMQPTAPSRPSPAMKAMEELRDLAKRQQELLDQTFRRAAPEDRPGDEGMDEGAPPAEAPVAEGQEGGGPPQAGQQQGAQQQGGGRGDGARTAPGDAAKAAQAQEALRRALSDIGRKLEQMMGQTPGALGQADKAMGGAAGALSRGAWGSAAEQQGEALRLMKEGAKQALQQLDQQGRGSGQLGLVPRDPFGRPMRGTGYGDDGTTRIPERAEVQRAREILDELRRRAGEARRPEQERDYLRRLLKQF